jgi:putative DNA primase/helicase
MKTGPFLEYARHLIENGYSPVPIRPGQKRPLAFEWETLRTTPLTEDQIQQVATYFPDAGLGVAGGFNDLVPIDVDTDDREIRAAVRSVLPKALVVKRGRRGATAFFRGKLASCKLKGADGKPLVEILSTGQSVIPPTIHPDLGKPYVWLTDRTLFDVLPSDLPEITEAHMEALRKALARWLPPPRVWTPKVITGAQRPSEGRLRAYAGAALDSEAKQLAAMGKDTGRNTELFAAGARLGNYVHHGVLAQAEVENALLGACTTNGLVNEDGQAACHATLTNGLEKAAGDELRQPPERPQPQRKKDGGDHSSPQPNGADSEAQEGIELPACSDEAIALKFADKHAGNLRYTHRWGQWHHFDGQRWSEDATLLAFDLARHLCREAAEGAKPSEAKDTLSAKKRAAVVSLAREDRRLAATVDQWDTDPNVLNTPAGTIDLHTFEMRPHNPGDYITRMTAVAPGGDCPRWLRFVDEITGGDKALAEFLQRMAGYSLTGDTSEHALFFAHGGGGNGKGVFMNTLIGIMGDYHRAAPIETFTASMGDRHPTEVAMLRGARLVTSTETEEGRRWAESKVKQLTGGDPVSARFMRQDFFTYTPAFKLLVSGNHKPSLRSVDESIRRRFNLIPFLQTFSGDDRDPDLGERLKAEWPGILQWMLDGCADWRERGLAPPEAVTKATAAYLKAEDSLQAWITERCEEMGEDSLARLNASWRQWAEQNGESPRTNKWLSAELEKKGFEPDDRTKGKFFIGLRVSASVVYGAT